MAQRLIVKGSIFASQTTLTLTVPGGSDTVAGRHLVAAFGFSGGVGTALSSVTDSKGNTWTIQASRLGTSGTANVYVAIASCRLSAALVAGDVITFTQNTATSYHLGAVYEVDNLLMTGRADASATGESTVSSGAFTTASSATTTQADEVIFAAVLGGDTATGFTSAAPWTELDEIQLVNTRTKTLRTACQTVTSTGQFAYSGTLAPDAVWVSALATYKTRAAATYLMSAWTGAVTPTGATVAIKAAGATSARLRVSSSTDLSSPVFSPAVAPDAYGLAKLTIAGLTPATQYYYGVELDGTVDAVQTGAFKTFPSGQSNFSFAFASCALSGSNNAVFDAIRTKTGPYGGPLMFCHLGDLHYENIATNSPTLYRNAYESVLSQSRQAALYRNVPTPYIWSDHDSGGNNHGAGDPGLLAAQPVYRLCVPHYPLPDSEGIYHSWVVGRIRFIATDLRSFKTPYGDADDANKTMMGATQKAWFKARLLDPEPVKVWLNELPWIQATTTGDDKWGSYTAERTEIADFVTTNGVKMVIISGDMHALAADDGTNSAGSMPVFHAGPLSNATSFKGGPYTQGSYPSPAGANANQFGWMDVTDAGNTVTFSYTGYDSTLTSRITLTSVITVGTNPGVTLTVASRGYYQENLALIAAGSDADGIASYAWTIIAAPVGSVAAIADPASASTIFSPDKPGDYTFQCVVTDGSGQTTTTSANVSVRPRVWVKQSGAATPAAVKQRKLGAASAVKPWTNTSGTAQ